MSWTVEGLVQESKKHPKEKAIALSEQAVELACEECGKESDLFIHASQNLAYIHMMVGDCQMAVDLMIETMSIANTSYTTDEVRGLIDMGSLRELFGQTLVERANQLDPRISAEPDSLDVQALVRQLRLHAAEQFRRAIGVAQTHVQLDTIKRRAGRLSGILLTLGEDLAAGHTWDIAAKTVAAELHGTVIDPETQPQPKRQRSR